MKRCFVLHMSLLLSLLGGCVLMSSVADKMADNPASFHGLWVHELENVIFWPDGRYSQECSAYVLGGTWKAEGNTLVVTVTSAVSKGEEIQTPFTFPCHITRLEQNLMVVGSGKNRRAYTRGSDDNYGSQIDDGE